VIELALLAFAAQVATDRVVVESATSCPTAADVEARLQVLLPPLPEGAHPERATLIADDGALRLHLSAADGTPLGERAVTVEASCADRANVVAVVIAAWELQRRAEHVEDPSLPHPPHRAPPPRASAAATVMAAPPPAPAPAGPRLEITFGPAVTFVDGGVAPTGTLGVGLWGRRVGARLELFGLLPRTGALGDGRARWTRVGAAFELGVRVRGRLGRLDAHAGLVAGVVVAQGQGFDLDHTTGGFSPGALAGLDWSTLLGDRFFVGAGARLSAWTAQRLVSDATTPVTRGLPRLQPALDVNVGVVF
jgi:hypothetical protein